ncbi:unnamed protein product [Allacma fusca]|uniref:Uncharacterized protein n=1 Tax=Allacma fusca TaxID=39272 RepID=A0A8J2P0K7_9HEXA|nr:unnamed protein product [Allacma fusca]
MFALLACPFACAGMSMTLLIEYVILFWVHPEFYLYAIPSCYDGFPDDGQKSLNLRELSFHELFATIIRPLVLAVPVLHVLIFLVIPTGPSFLYNYVPEHLKNPLTMSGSAVVEFYFMTFWMSMGLFTVSTHVLTFHNMILTQLKSGIRTMGDSLQTKKGRKQLQEALRKQWTTCRKIQLNSRIFNASNCNLQSMQIIWYFYECILLGYSGVRLFREDIVLGLFFVILSLIGAAFYIFTYEPAFGIPDMMEEFKSQLLELASICEKDRELAVACKRV